MADKDYMAKHSGSVTAYNQIPHFCTHAIEVFAELAERLPARLGIVPDFELLLCDLMRDAVKFLIPDNGYLFSDHDFRPSMFELLRLPYPLCALEFTATQELHAAHSGLVHAAKRIVLCFDPWQLPPVQIARLSRLARTPFLDDVPERCLALMVVYEADGVWGAAVGVVFIDLDGDPPMTVEDARAKEIRSIADQVGTRLKTKGSVHGLPASFRTFPARSELVGQSREEAFEALYIDTMDEVRAAYEFLAAINCSNVGTQELPAPKPLNEKRKKKGRPPFYAYKILDLSPAPAPGANPGAGGTHASPRAHLRRGHIRQLGERYGNKTLWINATRVNMRAGGEDVSTVYKVKT